MCWPQVPGTWCAMTVNSPRALALGITTQKTQVFQHLTLVVSSTVHHNLHPGLGACRGRRHSLTFLESHRGQKSA